MPCGFVSDQFIQFSLAKCYFPEITQFTKIISDAGINISDMTNKSKGEYAYTMLDLGTPATEELLKTLEDSPAVLRARIVK